MVFGPFDKTEFYLNAGMGFHSNDVRGATITVDPRSQRPLAAVPLLVQSRGAEVGVRTQAINGLDLSLALFLLDFDSELLFVGDAGTTEPSRPSRRIGVESTSNYRPTPWASFDLDLAYTRARFTDYSSAATRSRARRPSSPRAGSRSAATPAGSARCACAVSARGR